MDAPALPALRLNVSPWPGLVARVCLATLIALLLGCGSVKNSPTYTEQEMKERCERQGDRWITDDLRGGFCETMM